ncbi:MAG: tripartite tricarboxylate transporter substrate binding protein [Verrucomicrobiales bacterium]|nr:tripartite tricarboxylate transporter substrate binding protein [Verrucomicrobiales bacterium]
MWCFVQKTWLKLAFLFVALVCCSGCEEDFNSEPIKVIVPFAPGGGSDTLARVLVREIQKQPERGPTWVIINVPGAGGTIGSRRVKNARPDGKTLLFLHDGILTAKYAKQALYGPEAFTPIGVTGQLGMVICVAEESQFGSLRDLMQQAAAEPETVTFAANIGAPSYFMARRLEQAHGGAAFRYVQSGGGARRFADLSGGHVSASAFSISEYLNFREGGIRALAILDENRHPLLQDVPSAIEEDYQITYSNLQAWWAPAGTPETIIDELQLTLKRAIESPEMQRYSKQQCIDPLFMNSEGLELAMNRKSAELGNLKLGFDREHQPPIELMLTFCLLVGVCLSMSKPCKLPQKSKTHEPSHSSWKHIALATILVGFISSLSLPADMFLLAGIPFVLVSGLLTMGNDSLRLTTLIAIAAPLILFLFLSTLLGIDLP